jgi:hypothetical protein
MASGARMRAPIPEGARAAFEATGGSHRHEAVDESECLKSPEDVPVPRPEVVLRGPLCPRVEVATDHHVLSISAVVEDRTDL